MEPSPALFSSAAKSAFSRSRATIMPVKGTDLKGADLPPGEGKNSSKACLVLRLRFDKDKRVRGGWRRSRERREKAKVLAAFAALKDEGTEGYVASGKRG